MNFPKIDGLDPRLNVCSPRLADMKLKGQVNAEFYVEASPGQICVAVADLFRSPDVKTGIEAQLLFGQTVHIFDRTETMTWVQADHHNYVGWIASIALSQDVIHPTHRVSVPRTYLYPKADMKLKNRGQLSLGSLVNVGDTVTNRGTDYAILSTGESLIRGHVTPVDQFENDYVAVAESLLHVPYLWGGDSALGLDCSGLVQLSMAMTGKQVLRDSDMQAATIGEVIIPNAGYSNLERGDLIFWKGHVAIVRGGGEIIHANGHSMTVAIEPMEDAINRIAYLYDKPIGFRRP